VPNLIYCVIPFIFLILGYLIRLKGFSRSKTFRHKYLIPILKIRKVKPTLN